jgi:hypothetical protein
VEQSPDYVLDAGFAKVRPEARKVYVRRVRSSRLLRVRLKWRLSQHGDAVMVGVARSAEGISADHLVWSWSPSKRTYLRVNPQLIAVFFARVAPGTLTIVHYIGSVIALFRLLIMCFAITE